MFELPERPREVFKKILNIGAFETPVGIEDPDFMPIPLMSALGGSKMDEELVFVGVLGFAGVSGEEVGGVEVLVSGSEADVEYFIRLQSGSSSLEVCIVAD